MRPFFKRMVFAMALTLVPATGLAAEPVTLDNVVAPGPNAAEEPLGLFSLDKAADFLDSAALDWQKSRQCFTCHTNYAYLMARPMLSADGPAHQAVRAYAEELVTRRWPDQGPRWDAEIVMTAGVLAINDALTTGRLSPVTRKALDRMWSVQRNDGGFEWLKCEWPPMESDDHYGACFALVAVGAAPDEYAFSPAAMAGVERLRGYLAKNPAPTLHHSAMLLWASSKLEGIQSERQQRKVIDELSALQHADGGWGLATLGDWKRADGSPQDLTSSDGYGTGFVVYVLRQAGVPKDDPRVVRGVDWLKKNQRESGRWFTRSLFKDNKHFISHAGTAYAVMAIRSCEADLALRE
jgi:squalene-hopene/tetraprenyl-beta-curcumene cyclase